LVTIAQDDNTQCQKGYKEFFVVEIFNNFKSNR